MTYTDSTTTGIKITRRFWLSALCVLLLAGCTTPPKPTWFSRSLYKMRTLKHRLSAGCKHHDGEDDECDQCSRCKPSRPDIISAKTDHYSSMMDGMNTHKTAEHCAYTTLKAYRKKTNECLTEEFEEGFVQAYLDIADGYSGETPAIPSPKYWHAIYRTPEGNARVQHWFEGYRYGAINATQDGLAGNKVGTSVGTDDYAPIEQAVYPQQETIPLNTFEQH